MAAIRRHGAPPAFPLMPDPVPDPAPRVRRVIAVAATQRCGSGLLGHALAATGQAGPPLELINPIHLLGAREQFGIPRTRLARLPFAVLRRLSDDPRWGYDRTLGRAGAQEYMDFCTARYTTANGVFLIKYMWHQLEPVVGTPLDVATWDVPVTWIRQRRRDRALQAVSLMRARATGHYRRADGASAPVAYDAGRIAAAARLLIADDRGWDAYLARIGVDPLLVWYEDLDADYETEVRRVFDQVGLAGVPVPPRQVSRQRDATSQEWATRFRAACTDRLDEEAGCR